MPIIKKCKYCNESKESKDFNTNKSNQCKKCRSIVKKNYREKNKEKEKLSFLKRFFKRKYNITIEQYNEILEKQNGKCAICFSEKSRRNGKTNQSEPLAVDHCHKTGKVRGLLCTNCNVGIGLCKDNIELFYNCITYLQK
jgi:hypothetical protein